MKLTLIDRNPAVVSALLQAFTPHPEVEVIHGSFEEHMTRFDAFVTAGNGYGLMDGGIDQAVWNYFGPDTQERVQRLIRGYFGGFLPVGMALPLHVGQPGTDRDKLLIYAPTMPSPGNVAGSAFAYMAMLGTLKAAERTAHADAVLCTGGLCVATGQMPPAVSAGQMALAYRHFLAPPVLPDWPAVQQHVATVMAAGR